MKEYLETIRNDRPKIEAYLKVNDSRRFFQALLFGYASKELSEIVFNEDTATIETGLNFMYFLENLAKEDANIFVKLAEWYKKEIKHVAEIIPILNVLIEKVYKCKGFEYVG